MANVTAAMVKDLREKTGAGMMDCKAALNATDGDIEAGVDWLRTKGLAKAAKKSGRTAAEGLIGLAVGEGRGVLVEVNSETDFVARNESFQALVRGVAASALNEGGDAASLRDARLASGETIGEAITGAIATVGENMELRRVGRLTVSPGVVGAYLHGSVGEGLGRIGVLVALESSGKPEVLTALGRQIAMHVAAANPLALDPSALDPEVVAREKAILAEKHVGKPANVIEKITESGLKTYYKEVSLLEQSFVHDPSKTVAQAVKAAEGEAGAPIRLTAFQRFALGEGVEREATDFAAEVAAAGGAPAPGVGDNEAPALI